MRRWFAFGCGAVALRLASCGAQRLGPELAGAGSGADPAPRDRGRRAVEEFYADKGMEMAFASPSRWGAVTLEP